MNEEQKQTLGQIKATIDEWRKNKKHPSEKIPDDIWEAVFNFIETAKCPDNEVLKEIGIKSEQINSKRKSLGIKSEQINSKRKSLGLTQTLQPQQNSSIKADFKLNGENKLTQFEITRPDGLTVKFHAPLSELRNILI